MAAPPKFAIPGHWATGQRAEQHTTRQAGKTVVMGMLDDHSPLAYWELDAAENAENVSATLRRAVAWMHEHGCSSPHAVMSDNAACSARSHVFRQTLAELGAKHILIPPCTPRWNGKNERVFAQEGRQRAVAACPFGVEGAS